MILPTEFFDQLRVQIRISDVVRKKVSLTKKGNEYSGLCPFHSEKTPSFTVNDTKRFYHCFGCGAHGDIIKFTMETSGLGFKESCIKLAEDFGVEIPKLSKQQQKEYEESEHLQLILEQASKFFTDNLTSEVRSYLANRGIDATTIDAFNIGFAPSRGALTKYFSNNSIPLIELLKAGLAGKNDSGVIYEFFTNRIIFPIKNIYGKIVGFGGRVMDNTLPKYLNSPETLIFKKSEVVYGENIAASNAHKKNQVILVEGYMDVIALQKSGFNEAVACLGTAINEKHLQKLWRFADEIIVCLDGDEAGKKASLRLIDLALPHITPDRKVSFAIMPLGFDPDDVINKQGVEAFEQIIVNRNALSETIWLHEFAGKDFKTAEARAFLEGNLDEYVNKIKNVALSRNFKKFFSSQVWQSFSLNKSNSRSNKRDSTFISNQILNTPIFSEIEVLEKSLLALIINYPTLLSDETIAQEFYDIVFQDHNLSELRYWIIENYSSNENVDMDMIHEKAKRSRFSELYFVLCDPGALFLEKSFIEKNIANLNQIFNLYKKKHFLFQLRREYTQIANSNVESLESKAVFYIQEIQKINKEVLELNNIFIN